MFQWLNQIIMIKKERNKIAPFIVFLHLWKFVRKNYKKK